MNLKDFFIPCIDDYRKKVLCGKTKDTIKEYVEVNKALDEYKFLRFGNAYFLPSISIDIDHRIWQEEVYKIAQDNKIPYPSIMVYTDRGVHLHWVLTNPLSTHSEKAMYKYELILENLCKLYGSDQYAKAKRAGRVWRNPLLHDVTFWDEKYNLNDFNAISKKEKVDLNTSKMPKKKRKDGVKKVVWGNVTVGTRHNTLFDFIRKKAYRNYKKVEDFDSYLSNLAFSSNSMLLDPLPTIEVDEIVVSVINWMKTSYKGTGDEKQTEFNRKIAKKQMEKSVGKILKYIATHPFTGIKALKTKSSRVLSKIIGISHATIAKYKKNIKIIYDFLLNFKPLGFIKIAQEIVTEIKRLSTTIFTEVASPVPI